MAKTKQDPAQFAIEFEVLAACRNDKTGAAYQPGDVVTNEDFTPAVITNWLEIDPPVLRVRSANSGSDNER